MVIDIQNKWQKFKLGDVCDIINGGTPKTTVKEYWGGNIPWLSVKDFNNDLRYVYKTEKNITSLGVKKSSTNILKENDIIISARGTVGELAIIPFDMAFNQSCYGLRAKHNLYHGFLYYFLKKNINLLKNNTHGSVFDTITRDTLNDVLITLPPLEVQKKIAGVLGALDDKIELNNKINQNLEAQAQALFKSWFIDFEPFGGKMPDDWKEINLSDIAEFIGGYSYKSSELQSSSTVMATIKNFDRQGGFKLDGFKEISPSEKLKENQKISLFDTLVAHTDLTQNADVIGNAEMLLSTAGYSNVIISMDVVKVIPKKGISKFLLATLLKDNRFKQHCLGYINGTTVLHLSKKALPEYTFAFPNNMTDVAKLTNILEYLYKKLAYNIEENLRLAELRDTLLPKLMSGEINVDDVKID